MHELPVSLPQQRLWLIDQVEPGSPAYNVSRAFIVRGEIARDALARALRELSLRHDALRTTFTERDGAPVQRIHPMADLCLWEEDLQHLPKAERSDAARARAGEEARRPFDLHKGPLARVLLLHLASREHLLVITMHHIVTDGWSMGLLFADLAELYDAALAGRAPELPDVPLTYADFTRWQRDPANAGHLSHSVEYWRRTLAGAPPLLELPTDRPRPTAQGHRGATVAFDVPPDLATALKQLGERRAATPYMVLLAIWQLLLARYSGSDDIVVGSPVAGREQVELERVAGFFVNTIALRTTLHDDPTFVELLDRVRGGCLEAWAHQDAPFDRVVEALQPERTLAHDPIVQVFFILQNMPRQMLRIGEGEAEEIEFETGIAKADVTLEIVEAGGLHCTLEYRTDLFDAARMRRMGAHFVRLAREVTQAPDRRALRIDFRTDDERAAIVRWNDTVAAYPHDTSVAALFAEQAGCTPQRIALIGRERRVTYAGLASRARVFREQLAALGVTAGDRVAVCLERSVDAVAATLAILGAGAIVVPVDPSYPPARIAFMLEDSGAAAAFVGELPVAVPRGVPAIDVRNVPWSPESAAAPGGGAPAGGDVPAYLIYTSGSTGTPKGVLGTHRGIVNRLSWMWRTYPFVADEVCVHKTALSFVDAIAEIFLGLLQGVPTVVLGDEVARDPTRLAAAIEGHRVTRLVLVPSLLRALLDHVDGVTARLASLRICVTSGEALPRDLFDRVRSALPHVRLLNLYGSSEVAADVTCFDAEEAIAGEAVPIGRPIDNTFVSILDARREPVPLGVPGEIWIGGDGVALGYHGRADLTAERFISAPGRGRVFKTGDRGCVREDGHLEYLGRLDQQVKLRGMRIELGEIEATLVRHGEVTQALALLDSHGGDPRLVAYVVAGAGAAVTPHDLRSHLARELPEHMVPQVIVRLEAFPLTPNGKIDRSRLPAPIAQASSGVPPIAPRDEVEAAIARIWCDVLQRHEVGVHDRFFELGGHSLSGMQVLARIRRTFDVELQLRALFDEPTVAGLARAVAQARSSGTTARTPRIAPRRHVPGKAALLAQIEGMSDEEVDALLQAALARRGQAAGA